MRKFCLLMVSVGFILCFLASSASPEIVLMHDKGGVPPWQEPLEKMAEYCLAETGLTFKPIPYPSTDVFMAAVRTALPTSKAPELFTWWSDFRMKPLVDAGLLADLTSIWEKRKDEYSKDLRGAFDFGDKVYAAPTLLTYWVVWYNKRLFDRYNLSEPKTWEEFLSLCEFFKSKNIIPLGQTVKGRWPGFIWFEELVVRLDPDFYERLVIGKAKYTDTTVKRAFEIWKDMLEKGYFADPATDIWADFPRLMATDKAAMILIGGWYSQVLDTAGLKVGVDYDGFILPPIDPSVGNVIIYEMAPLVVGANSVRRDDAIKIIDWWMSPSAQKKWCEMMGFFPPNLKVSAEFLPPPKQKLRRQIIEGGYRLVNRYWEATPTEICEEAVDKFNEFVLNPDKYEKIMADLEKIAQEYWGSR